MTLPIAVILAGGQNSRFFPFNTTHKGHLSLLGQTLIERTLHNLAQHGFDRFVVVVAPRDQQPGGLVEHLRQLPQAAQITLVEQSQPLGMGDALLQARLHLDGQFVVLSPYQFQAASVINQLMSLGTSAAVCAYPTTQPWLFGMVAVENGRLTGIVEKPAPGQQPSDLAIQTLYLLDQAFLQLLAARPNEEYSFESALDALAQQEPVGVLELPESLSTLKYPWHLFDLQAQLFSQATSFRHPSAQIAATAILDDTQGPIIIEAGAKISDFAKIVGPAYIGRNVLVGEYCFIRSSSLEAETRIGANTEVVRSIVMEHGELHQSYLADSILGRHVHAGAGFISANLRLDKKSVPVLVKGQKVDSGRRKLGVMMGERANLGIKVGTMPGVAIGSQAVVFPGLTIFKPVDHQATITSDTK